MSGAGKQFMEMTKYKNMTGSPQQAGQKQPPLEVPADPATELIALHRQDRAPAGDLMLMEAINRRRSLRAYSDQGLSLEELALLLWCSQGVQESSAKHTMRTVPSAGARHAFETYVLVNRVDGLKPGLYRYVASSHALAVLDLSQGVAEELTAACLGQPMIDRCAAAFFWAAELERMYYRYEERGYRYLHLDAGHICQNLSLAAEAVGCGACAIGAFDDDALNDRLGLDGENRFAVYAAVVGKR